MGWGTHAVWRRVGATLALWGIIAYTALIPGHFVNQIVDQLVKAELGPDFGIICHSDANSADKPSPEKSKKHCPFCAGYASFQLASLGMVQLAIGIDRIPSAVAWPETESVPDKGSTEPKSRGPPAHFS